MVFTLVPSQVKTKFNCLFISQIRHQLQNLYKTKTGGKNLIASRLQPVLSFPPNPGYFMFFSNKIAVSVSVLNLLLQSIH